MSQENVEVVRRALELANGPNAEALIALCDEAVEFRPLVVEAEGGRTYRGAEGIRRWLRDTEEVWPDSEATVERFIDRADIVIAVGKTTWRGRASGVRVEGRWAMNVRFMNGKIAGWFYYPDEKAALEAAGLRE
jgi:ketosteroid isomerase-like protein